MPDPLFICFVTSDRLDAWQRLSTVLKGVSSRLLRQELRDLVSKWPVVEAVDYAGTVGQVAKATV